jgi:hypothetical protein
LLSYEAYLTQKPVCHPKYSTLVANSSFDLGCGFPTTTHAQISIAGCTVNLNHAKAKELVAEYSVTCANHGPQTVMADNVAVGSLEVVSAEVGRQNLVEVSQSISFEEFGTYEYQKFVNNQTKVNAFVKVSLMNNSSTTKTVTLNDDDFWFSCSSVDLGNGVSFRNLGDQGWCDDTYSNLFATFGKPKFDPEIISNWSGHQTSYTIPSGKSVIAIFPIEVSFTTANSSLKLPDFMVNGETFCENCSPSISFGATQPTATVPIATATPISGETPTPTATLVPDEPTPTATMPVSGETPIATTMPNAARRVYLPLVIRN